MRFVDLEVLGATVACGHVDINNVYVGKLLKDGDVLLTPEGEQIVADAQVMQEAKEQVVKAAKAGKATKTPKDEAPSTGGEG